MRFDEMIYATNRDRFGGKFGLVGFLGYAATGYNGVK